MNAGEFCNRTVYIIRANETVLEAAQELTDLAKLVSCEQQRESETS